MREFSVSTFSITAVDPATGDCGVACASKFLAAGSLVPWLTVDVGAIATQALVNASLGSAGLALLAEGVASTDALAAVLAGDPSPERRQIGIVGLSRGAAAHTGSGCKPHAGHRIGDGFTCQGNMLPGPEVLDRMVSSFSTTKGFLGHRLVAALAAGDEAGGDRRGRQSAAVKVLRRGGGYQGLSDIAMDLRVDDHPDPVAEIQRLMTLHDLYFLKGDPKDRLEIVGDLLEELCAMAANKGLLPPVPITEWSEPARQALDALIGTANLEERADLDRRWIDRSALEHLRAGISSIPILA